MVFGDVGGHGTNPNPLRTIGEIFNPGCVAARAMGQFGQFHPNRVDNRGGGVVACV